MTSFSNHPGDRGALRSDQIRSLDGGSVCEALTPGDDAVYAADAYRSAFSSLCPLEDAVHRLGPAQYVNWYSQDTLAQAVRGKAQFWHTAPDARKSDDESTKTALIQLILRVGLSNRGVRREYLQSIWKTRVELRGAVSKSLTSLRASAEATESTNRTRV